MALQQIFGIPQPKLPAYTSTNIADFGNSPLAPLPQRSGVLTPQTKLQMAPMVLQQPPSGAPAGKGNFMQGVKSVAPYLSNVSNMFSKPPLPPAPSYLDPVNFQRVSLDSERAMADQQLRGADLAADRYLDGQNAVAARIGGYTQRMKSLSEIAGRERHENTQIANRETELNANISARNLGAKDQHSRDLVDRSMAMTRARSENMANLSDKIVASGNESALRDLDQQKMKVLSRMSPDVWKRLVSKLKTDGVDLGI